MPVVIHIAGVHESEDDALSHIAQTKTCMVEERFLLDALRDLGYSIDKGTVKYDGDCITVRTPGGRPKLVFRKEHGAYKASVSSSFNFFGLIGNDKGLLHEIIQRYAFHVVVSSLQEQGFSISSQELEDNDRVRLTMRRVAL